MGQKKSIYTVKQATAIAFKEMPERFQSINLVMMARSIMGRPSCSDGNILRRLRELRAEAPQAYNYRCIDTERSIYHKHLKTA